MAFRAFHTLSFPWPALEVLIKLRRFRNRCFAGAQHALLKVGSPHRRERNYLSDAPSRREDRYCVGDIPKEALNNRLKWAESLNPHL
jgi:hypothetical protein